MVVQLEYTSNGKVTSTPREWKDVVPYLDEPKVLCVAIGNSHYNWSFMEGKKMNFVPLMFWKTPSVTPKDMKKESPSKILVDHMPSQITQEFFGSFPTTDKARANQLAAAQRIPARSVYILSTNRDNERGFMYALSELYVRVFRMENSDFFTPEDGCYDTLGVDRASCLYAGFTRKRYPLLILDGGTAMTYTGLDAKGKIMGGGISPGLAARFQALRDYCGRLPLISFDEFDQADPLPFFAKDTRSSMMTAIFQEVGVHSRNIVKQFLKALKTEDGGDGNSEEGQNKEPNLVTEKKITVYVTGGDSDFLMRCLHETDELPLAQLTISETKHLALYGIGQLVQEKANEAHTFTPEEEIRLRILGQRVAKKFATPDMDGDFTYRGSIVSVAPGEKQMEKDLYSVRYDDGDAEEFSLTEVYDGLKLYFRVGEKETVEKQIWTDERKDECKAGAAASSEQLLKGVPTLAKTLEKRAEEEKAAAAAASAAAAVMTLIVPETTKIATPKPAKRQRGANSSEKPLLEPKKAKPESESETSTKNYLGLGVAKYFPIENDKGELEDVLYIGKVESYDQESNFWHIRYEDNDEEDYDETDLKKAIQLYIEKRGKGV